MSRSSTEHDQNHSTMNAPHYASADAFSWLRETDTLEVTTIKRAIWEKLVVIEADEGQLVVQNHSYGEDYDDHTHTVNAMSGIVSSCTCPQYKYRNKVCKHMVGAALAIENEEVEGSQKIEAD